MSAWLEWDDAVQALMRLRAVPELAAKWQLADAMRWGSTCDRQLHIDWRTEPESGDRWLTEGGWRMAECDCLARAGKEAA